MARRRKDLPSIELLRHLFTYNHETGVIANRITSSHRSKIGTEAGCVVTVSSGKTYRQIRIKGSNYYSHAIAIALVTGTWPTKEVDHKDGDGLNNSYKNLREVTTAQNQHNRQGCQRNNTTGVHGVNVVVRRSGKLMYQARIKVQGVRIHLGVFSTLEAASAVYLAAKRSMHSGFLG